MYRTGILFTKTFSTVIFMPIAQIGNGVTDISYLSAIRDLYDNFIVAYKTAKRQDYSLVDRTIRAALAAESPAEKVILHSDQGGQYRSFDYRACTEENSLTPSMSSPGTPGDNACAENFFSIFKTECIY